MIHVAASCAVIWRRPHGEEPKARLRASSTRKLEGGEMDFPRFAHSALTCFDIAPSPRGRIKGSAPVGDVLRLRDVIAHDNFDFP